MLVVFLVLGFGATIQGMPASGGPISYLFGVGMAHAVAPMLGVAALILLLDGVYYVTARKGGATFRESFFNWPLVIVAGIAAFMFLL